MIQLILVIHVLICLFLVVLVLLQQGKGAEMGAGFGSGASNTVFGSQGATPFLIKVTLGLAVFFFLTSLLLNYLTAQHVKSAKASLLPSVPSETMNFPVSAVADGNEEKTDQ
ncbi:MAG: secG [Gammaproteobacteria bacterium]|jgi:preprotein translocase subunit SecG|nr:secG [Gammaproteobacteria bacterium]